MSAMRFERSVQYYETDKMGCVHHSNYIRWFEEARTRFMREKGMSYEQMEARGILSPVLRVEADYKTMTRFGETVEIEICVESYTGARIIWAYTVRDKDTGTVRCVGKSSHCFLDGTGKPVSLKKADPEYDAAVRQWVEPREKPAAEEKARKRSAEKGMDVTVVVNPNAGRQNILKELDRVHDIFTRHGANVTMVETKSAEQAAQVIWQAVEIQPDVLVCCGGDGTLSQTVSQVLDSGAKVKLGYIPAGTTNDFASSLKLPLDPEQAALHIVRGSPRPLDTGLFGKDRHFIYIASFGAFTHSSYSTTQAMKNSLGHLAYLIEGLKELPALKTYRVKAETAEGGVYEGEYIFGSVSNSLSMGGVVKLDGSQVDLFDGKFELTLVKAPKNLLEFNQIILPLMNGKIDEEWITFVPTTGVTFTCEEAMPWSLDGEYAPGGHRVEISVQPRSIELYC